MLFQLCFCIFCLLLLTSNKKTLFRLIFRPFKWFLFPFFKSDAFIHSTTCLPLAIKRYRIQCNARGTYSDQWIDIIPIPIWPFFSFIMSLGQFGWQVCKDRLGFCVLTTSIVMFKKKFPLLLYKTSYLSL